MRAVRLAAGPWALRRAARAASANANPSTLTIVSPVTGHPAMRRALQSVQRQQGVAGRLRHLVLIDGPRPGATSSIILDEQREHPLDLVQLPYAVGTDGWLGHRIYGASAFLSTGDFIAYLVK